MGVMISFQACTISRSFFRGVSDVDVSDVEVSMVYVLAAYRLNVLSVSPQVGKLTVVVLKAYILA